jgi:hypothetical protein
MDFVGELYIMNILRDTIAKAIFENLLDKNNYTDDTIEAALRFINKIGPALEKKHEAGKTGLKFDVEAYEGVLKEFSDIQ